jgi:hypothetical protein
MSLSVGPLNRTRSYCSSEVLFGLVASADRTVCASQTYASKLVDYCIYPSGVSRYHHNHSIA